ncbi:PTS glucose transporter subunit IIA [Marmoricola endophyticus]|uniref:PTS glucose transporter subunit IIA n=1 Tax=Marmoricola endophyticus TaxID=2040280 RepID=A0A917BEV2_9ACTN|nr:PTS glucose transporter subunit IIA [Marmoricola endophyticus]GGF38773.1 PTS glucose transporter subunit IIA [Marmoricola endophyticus]
MSLAVLAPCPGSVLPMDEVPDPVFAGGMVGPGVAIDPTPGETTVVSPIAGRVVKVHPHAFVVLGEGGIGVLVHLGIDTVKLDGKGFEVLATEKSTVEAGDPMVRWDPSAVTADGLSPVIPVVVMEAPKDSVAVVADGDVAPGDLLLTVG